MKTLKGANIRRCDECGRPMPKAHRIERGHAYCSTCYARVFKIKPCKACATPTRCHKHDGDPRCNACANENRQCGRCAKPITKAGLIVNNIPICNSCAPHFRAPQACANCGKLSSRLSHAPKLGLVGKVCQSCYNLDHATCHGCRKSRSVAKLDIMGRPLCKRCSEGSLTAKACPSCKCLLNSAGHCRRCSLTRRLNQYININVELIEQHWCQELFKAFCKRPTLHFTEGTIARRINHYVLFFYHIDHNFTTVSELTQERLLGLFGAEELRRNYHIITFLCENNSLNWCEQSAEEFIEQKRITKLLEQEKSKPWFPILSKYASYLSGVVKSNDKMLQSKTIRVYLRSAAGYLDGCDEHINQARFTDFCRRNKGLSASLSAFAAFISINQYQPIAPLQNKKAHEAALEKALIKECHKLMARLASATTFTKRASLTAALVSRLYQLPLNKVLKLERNSLNEIENGLQIEMEGETIPIYNEMVPLLQDILRHPSTSDYLFQGRTSYRSLTPSSVRYHLRR